MIDGTVVTSSGAKNVAGVLLFIVDKFEEVV